ncbi:thioredoxin family protein [Lederbergia wuyishanensis]|uniref:Thioredoxin n=1 Tax=Lederbergia wuyishanensis TaxID=1347903 RepID=A0ABU0D887_9BACI|nr:thioredoxin domain-containing protein [Lederbergia wuyishanensis]MCJ8009253.1 thioredoxin [Lederbergia wuyishanensis]MDQ0344614.1 thioredoxin 1 [Lederbergia wuyishanensis]
MSKVTEVTKENFQQEVLECKLPVLVDFYTDGCGPCEAMVPVLDEVSVNLEGKVKFVKHHVTMEDVLEDQSWIVKKYDVMGFPTLMLFQNGEVLKTFIGALYEEELMKFLSDVL